MRKLLFRNKKHQDIGQMIKEMWTERKDILDSIKNRLESYNRTFTNRSNITLQRKKCESDPGPNKGGCDYLKQRHKFNSIGRG